MGQDGTRWSAEPAASATSGATDAKEHRRRGVRIEAEHLTRRVRGGASVLSDVSLSVEPGELVAIVGGSGAGKTTLLDALAGVQPADDGHVRLDGTEMSGNLLAWRRIIGYVPQEDIIHVDLPLARTLRYAARLRLPTDTTPEEIDQAVAETLRALRSGGARRCAGTNAQRRAT